MVNLTLMQKAGQEQFPIGIRVFPVSASAGLLDFFYNYMSICWVSREVFEHEADWLSAQTSPEGLASVNVMKQTCVIIILAYFT